VGWRTSASPVYGADRPQQGTAHLVNLPLPSRLWTPSAATAAQSPPMLRTPERPYCPLIRLPGQHRLQTTLGLCSHTLYRCSCRCSCCCCRCYCTYVHTRPLPGRPSQRKPGCVGVSAGAARRGALAASDLPTADCTTVRVAIFAAIRENY
jgi:hypothetical protein